MRHIAVPDREAAEVDKAKGGEEELEGVSWGDTPDGVSDTTEQPWVQGKGKRRGKVRKRNKEEENETASAGFEGTPKKIVGMQRMEVPKDLEAVSSQQLSSVESVAAEEVMGSVSPSSSMIPDTGLEEEVLQSAVLCLSPVSPGPYDSGMVSPEEQNEKGYVDTEGMGPF
ncbi:UNVERIFIED_CONTAM: hypothetical protein FKN15_017938 [Acipenser sinensis]